MTEPQNKGMKLSKPEYLGGNRPLRSGVIQAGFAAYAPCWADTAETRVHAGRIPRVVACGPEVAGHQRISAG
jgi:hypothetical protein